MILTLNDAAHDIVRVADSTTVPNVYDELWDDPDLFSSVATAIRLSSCSRFDRWRSEERDTAIDVAAGAALDIAARCIIQMRVAKERAQ